MDKPFLVVNFLPHPGTGQGKSPSPKSLADRTFEPRETVSVAAEEAGGEGASAASDQAGGFRFLEIRLGVKPVLRGGGGSVSSLIQTVPATMRTVARSLRESKCEAAPSARKAIKSEKFSWSGSEDERNRAHSTFSNSYRASEPPSSLSQAKKEDAT